MTRGLVAIIGRPNVGKSTLFNRLTSSQRAIVDDLPGVTRDRLYGLVEASDEALGSFIVIDTGGFETKDYNFQPFGDNLVWQQTEVAIEEADICLLVVDAKAGRHPHDEDLFRSLKKKQKSIILVINKIDGAEQNHLTFEFYTWGIQDVAAISAAHNRGVGDLREKIEEMLLARFPHKQKDVGEDSEVTKVAIVGKPNVGKSSILNRLLGRSRAVVSEVAGTTRDVVDTPFNYNKRRYLLLDTAGIRKAAKISDKLESLSVLKSLRALEEADVVVLVIDAEQGFNDQDARLCSLAIRKYKPVLIVVNKWDLMVDKTTRTAADYQTAIRYKIKQFAYVPIVFVSSLHNRRVFSIFKAIEQLSEIYHKRVSTSDLNDLLADVVNDHTPALIHNYSKRIKFYYAAQVRSAPPTFVVKCNVADDIQESYKRYILNRFRDDLGFKNIPLQLIFRDKKDQTSTPN